MNLLVSDKPTLPIGMWVRMIKPLELVPPDGGSIKLQEGEVFKVIDIRNHENGRRSYQLDHWAKLWVFGGDEAEIHHFDAVDKIPEDYAKLSGSW